MTPEEIFKSKIKDYNAGRSVATLFKIQISGPLLKLSVAAMQEYAQTISEGKDREIEEKDKLILELKEVLENVMNDGKGTARDQFGDRLNLDKWESFVRAKETLNKIKLNN